MTHLLVTVDKFTKRIKVKPIKNLDAETAVEFLTYIIHRFGIPKNISADNGSNISLGALRDYYRDKGTRLDLASLAHPSQLVGPNT